MAWKIEYADAASRVIRKLDRQQARRVLDYMDHRVAAADDPRQLGAAMVGDRAGSGDWMAPAARRFDEETGAWTDPARYEAWTRASG